MYIGNKVANVHTNNNIILTVSTAVDPLSESAIATSSLLDSSSSRTSRASAT